MSAYITLSTMAAAALGNTFSDVIGIGSSYYVERAAAMLGFGAPALSPVQLDMPVSRRFANMVCPCVEDLRILYYQPVTFIMITPLQSP